jgi:hypothetical protein
MWLEVQPPVPSRDSSTWLPVPEGATTMIVGDQALWGKGLHTLTLTAGRAGTVLARATLTVA